MAGEAVLRLYHPTISGQIDCWMVNGSGNVIQKSWSPTYSNGGQVASGAVANCTPEGEWTADGVRVDLWCPAPSSKVLHAYWDGSSWHQEVV